MKIVTVKEYAKSESISEQGARKRVASKLVESCKIGDNLYIVVEDDSIATVDKLKTKVKLLQAQVKTYKAQAETVAAREDYVKRLESRVDKLEESLSSATEKKEELYEKVLAQVLLPK